MGPNDGDDDLIVELEEVDDLAGLPPPPEEDVEDEPQRTPEVDRLPDDEEGVEIDEAPVARRAAREEVEDTSADDAFNERAREMERQTREFRAESIWREANAYAENYRTQRAQADLGLSYVNDKIEAAYQALAYAEENGDTATKIQTQRHLDELKNLQGQIQHAKAQVPDPDRVIAEGRNRALSLRDAPQEETGVQVGANLRARTPLAAEWAKSNASWMKSDAKANEFVILQSGEMAKSGWSPSERGFYAELSRRVQARFPALKVAKPNAAKGAAPQRRQSAVAPSRPSSATPSARQSNSAGTRVRLDASEQAKMKRFNLDPANADHRKHYAKVLLQRQRRDAQQGA